MTDLGFIYKSQLNSYSGLLSYCSPKPIIGTLIGTGLAVASSVIGGIASAKQNRKAEKQMDAQNARNNAWYNRRYNEDYLDTAAGQNLMRQAKEYADRNWKKERGANAVAGGTDASAALAKESGLKMVGDTASQIAAADTARKDNVDNIHQQQENNYSAQKVALAQQRANNISQAAGSASDALFKAGSAFDADYSVSNTAKAAGTVAPTQNPQSSGYMDPIKESIGLKGY